MRRGTQARKVLKVVSMLLLVGFFAAATSGQDSDPHEGKIGLGVGRGIDEIEERQLGFFMLLPVALGCLIGLVAAFFGARYQRRLLDARTTRIVTALEEIRDAIREASRRSE